MRFRTRRAALALALLLAPPPLAPTGAASERPAAERPALGWLRLEDGDRPNVLLITVDTLRADHVGRSARFPESFTPKLDALAKDSTVFSLRWWSRRLSGCPGRRTRDRRDLARLTASTSSFREEAF